MDGLFLTKSALDLVLFFSANQKALHGQEIDLSMIYFYTKFTIAAVDFKTPHDDS